MASYFWDIGARRFLILSGGAGMNNYMHYARVQGKELLHSKDEILQKFLYGDSGENWAALSGKNETFQRVLLERAERERKQ